MSKLATVAALLLACLAGASVQAGGVSTGTLSITVTDPTLTLDNIWLLIDKGDSNGAFAIAGSAPAGAVTLLTLTTFTPPPVPIPGNPAFGVVATYGGGSPVGVFAALDPTTAAALVSAAATFDAAFPRFSACSESDLIAALVGTGGCAGTSAFQTVTSFGAAAYYGNGNDAYPWPGTGLLASYSGSGDSADFVSFSTAAAGGSITVSYTPASVPEPGGWLMLGSGLAFVSLRRNLQRKGRA